LRKLFGSFYNDDTKELFSDKVVFDTKCLGESLSKFEPVSVAFTYIRIFYITTPVSDYLQTPGLDVLHAWRMISEATDKLNQIAKDFAAIYQHATTFIDGVNDKLSEEGIRLTTDLPEIRATPRARGVQSAEKNFEIICHNVILDTVVLSISNRFSDHKKLYNEIVCFDPNRFKEVKIHPEMTNLTTIAEALLKLSRHGLFKRRALILCFKLLSRDGFSLALARGGAGGVLFFIIKKKIIRDKMRYSNLNNNMMINEL
jgi:hypothetical protein